MERRVDVEQSQPMAERWLNGCWDVPLETLRTLSDRRGAQERVSLKLLVEELCNLYERETDTHTPSWNMLPASKRRPVVLLRPP